MIPVEMNRSDVPFSNRAVVVESPFAHPDTDHEKFAGPTIDYARESLRYWLRLGAAPFASHLLYTQPGVLDDRKPEQRNLGIEAGLIFQHCAFAVAYHLDLGVSSGMFRAADHLARYESTGRVRYVVFCMLRGEPLPYYEAKGVLSLIDRLRTSTERRILFADASGIHSKVMDPSEAHRFASNILFPQSRE